LILVVNSPSMWTLDKLTDTLVDWLVFFLLVKIVFSGPCQRNIKTTLKVYM